MRPFVFALRRLCALSLPVRFAGWGGAVRFGVGTLKRLRKLLFNTHRGIKSALGLLHT
jgi:hypothetical protein